MKIVVKTQSGSVYTFDTVKMTWTRENPKPVGDTYLAGEGELAQLPEIVFGEGMRIPVIDPLAPDGWTILYTSVVTDFENMEA